MDMSETHAETDAGESLGAIGFKAEFAPAQESGSQSGNQSGSHTYFGGRPCLPPELFWPELTRGGARHALTFLGQIDLADIAPVGMFEALPQSGVLYFFLDTNLIMEAGLGDDSVQDGTPWRVLYAADGADHREPTATPVNLMPCFGHPYAGTPSEMRWVDHLDWQARYYCYEAPRVRMQPLALQSFRIRGDSFEADERRRRAAWIDTFGQPVARTGFAAVAGDRRGELFLLAQFPATNIYLEIFAGGLLKNILGPWENGKLMEIGGDHVPAIREILAEIQPDNLFCATSPARQDRLLSIMHDLLRRDPSVTFTLNRLLRTAYFWGSSLSLSYSEKTARATPDELAGITRDLFYPLQGDAEHPDRVACTQHQMLGYGIDPQSRVQGGAREWMNGHILLMQFDSDNGMGWMFGDCGVAQFWITPDDLAARRFDRVIATVEGT